MLSTIDILFLCIAISTTSLSSDFRRDNTGCTHLKTDDTVISVIDNNSVYHIIEEKNGAEKLQTQYI